MNLPAFSCDALVVVEVEAVIADLVQLLVAIGIEYSFTCRTKQEPLLEHLRWQFVDSLEVHATGSHRCGPHRDDEVQGCHEKQMGEGSC